MCRLPCSRRTIGGLPSAFVSAYFEKKSFPDKDFRKNVNRPVPAPVPVPFSQQQQRILPPDKRSPLPYIDSNRRDFETRPPGDRRGRGKSFHARDRQSKQTAGSSIYKRAEKRHAPANPGIYFYGPPVHRFSPSLLYLGPAATRRVLLNNQPILPRVND